MDLMNNIEKKSTISKKNIFTKPTFPRPGDSWRSKENNFPAVDKGASGMAGSILEKKILSTRGGEQKLVNFQASFIF